MLDKLKEYMPILLIGIGILLAIQNMFMKIELVGFEDSIAFFEEHIEELESEISDKHDTGHEWQERYEIIEEDYSSAKKRISELENKILKETKD